MLVLLAIIFMAIVYILLLGLFLYRLSQDIFEILISKKGKKTFEIITLICLFILLMPLSIIGCLIAIYLICEKYYIITKSKKMIKFLCKKLAQDKIALTEITMDYLKKEVREKK